jgi:hypothetical protein
MSCLKYFKFFVSSFLTDLSIHLPIYLSIHPTICLSIHPSVYISIYLYLSIYLFIYLSIHLSIHPSICLSIHLSIYLFIYLSVCLCLYSPLLDLGRFTISWSRTQTVGLLGRGSTRRKAATCTQRKTQTQTFIPWVGFEPKTPVFERAKTVHALDRAAAVIGISSVTKTVMIRNTESIKTVGSSTLQVTIFLYQYVCTMHLNHKKQPKIIWTNAGYEVLSAVIMNSSSFCHIPPWSSVLSASCWLLIWLNIRPWRWERYDPPKSRMTSTALHFLCEHSSSQISFPIWETTHKFRSFRQCSSLTATFHFLILDVTLLDTVTVLRTR